jgi:23S rRNA (pseudouridine1915-N3)-methyltransferase
VKIKVAWIGKTKERAIQELTNEYLKRISRYAEIEGLTLRDEATLLAWREGNKSGKRTPSTLVLLDSKGKQFSSEEFAKFIGEYQDRNPLPLIFAIGPADGFSDDVRKAAQHAISLGKMTLAHELARVVLLEQIYRAFTILKKHPYHTGH